MLMLQEVRMVEDQDPFVVVYHPKVIGQIRSPRDLDTRDAFEIVCNEHAVQLNALDAQYRDARENTFKEVLHKATLPQK